MKQASSEIFIQYSSAEPKYLKLIAKLYTNLKDAIRLTKLSLSSTERKVNVQANSAGRTIEELRQKRAFCRVEEANGGVQAHPGSNSCKQRENSLHWANYRRHAPLRSRVLLELLWNNFSDLSRGTDRRAFFEELENFVELSATKVRSLLSPSVPK